MHNSLHLRSWATPLTIGSFVLMAATGLLMFFEWNTGLVTVVHQWFSWLFLIGATGHVVANIRPFTRHLGTRAGRASVAIFTMIAGASVFSYGLTTGPQLERPIEQALVDARLSALAEVISVTPETLLARLASRGVDARSEQTIGELASLSGVDENRLLGIVFLP